MSIVSIVSIDLLLSVECDYTDEGLQAEDCLLNGWAEKNVKGRSLKTNFLCKLICLRSSSNYVSIWNVVVLGVPFVDLTA